MGKKRRRQPPVLESIPEEEPPVDLTSALVPVSIRLSSIAGAGFGVYAEALITEKTLIALYEGEVIEGRPWGGNYVVCIDEKKQMYIDGCGEPRCVAAMINDARTEIGNNCELKTDISTKSAAVFAIRDILPGEELFMSYGPDFW